MSMHAYEVYQKVQQIMFSSKIMFLLIYIHTSKGNNISIGYNVIMSMFFQSPKHFWNWICGITLCWFSNFCFISLEPKNTTDLLRFLILVEMKKLHRPNIWGNGRYGIINVLFFAKTYWTCVSWCSNFHL